MKQQDRIHKIKALAQEIIELVEELDAEEETLLTGSDTKMISIPSSVKDGLRGLTGDTP